ELYVCGLSRGCKKIVNIVGNKDLRVLCGSKLNLDLRPTVSPIVAEDLMIRIEGSRGSASARPLGTLSPSLAHVEPGAFAMERILVVEDDRAVQKALRRLFES